MSLQKTPTLNAGNAEEILEKIKVFLEKLIHEHNLVQYYWEASQKAEELILNFLGDKEFRFPVDVEKLALKMGVRIEEDKLDEFSGEKDVNKRIGQIVMQEDFFQSRICATIYLEKSISPDAKRYAIAHELVHYIIHKNERNFYEDYCSMPLCPIKQEEIVVDIFATFLLIPVRLFFGEFYSYVQQRTQGDNVPIATEYWIHHLSERSLVPEYYVAYGYQQLRYVGYWIYRAWKLVEKIDAFPKVSDGRMDVEIGDEDTEMEISGEQPVEEKSDPEELSDDEKQEVREIWENTKDYFNEEIMELLFQ